jgi:hypothetical protein
MMSLIAALPVITSIIDKIFPDKDKADLAKLELFRLQQSGELALLAAEAEIVKGQLEINTEEAKSASLFVAGWRPAVGWLCVAGLTYNFVLQPLLTWVSRIYDFDAPPQLDIEDLIMLLLGMLGLGGLRSFEKVKGVTK